MKKSGQEENRKAQETPKVQEKEPGMDRVAWIQTADPVAVQSASKAVGNDSTNPNITLLCGVSSSGTELSFDQVELDRARFLR